MSHNIFQEAKLIKFDSADDFNYSENQWEDEDPKMFFLLLLICLLLAPRGQFGTI